VGVADEEPDEGAAPTEAPPPEDVEGSSDL